MSAPAPAKIDRIAELDTACRNLIAFRGKPLLVLYYPGGALFSEDDLGDVYASFRAAHVTVEGKMPFLDVLIESNGGNPVAGYRLAQLIRDFANEVFFLVADHAYSAATLLCFSGNGIRLAHYAGLSPIDITLVSAPGRAPRKEVELANIDNFLEFAKECRRTIQELLQSLGCPQAQTTVDSDLLVEMVKEVGALDVGKFFRERALTGFYAQELLDHYMFPACTDAKDRRRQVIHSFLFGAPAHEFHIDYHLCANWKLAVEEMGTEESDLAKAAVNILDDLARGGIICPPLARPRRMSFCRYYPLPQAAGGDAHAAS